MHAVDGKCEAIHAMYGHRLGSEREAPDDHCHPLHSRRAGAPAGSVGGVLVGKIITFQLKISKHN